MVRVLMFTSGFDAVWLAQLLVVLSPSLVRLIPGVGVVPGAVFHSRLVQCFRKIGVCPRLLTMRSNTLLCL